MIINFYIISSLNDNLRLVYLQIYLIQESLKDFHISSHRTFASKALPFGSDLLNACLAIKKVTTRKNNTSSLVFTANDTHHSVFFHAFYDLLGLYIHLFSHDSHHLFGYIFGVREIYFCCFNKKEA